jgi:hypothetical protein
MKRAWLVCFCMVSVTGHAYELGTHGRLTYQAYAQSVLSDAQLTTDLGYDSFDPANPFGKYYYDVAGNQIKERLANAFEESEKRMPDGAKSLSISGWLMRGAIREDDVMLGLADGQPQDDPYSPLIGFMRVFNHFYDPINRQPLNKDGTPVGQITCAAGAVIGDVIPGGIGVGLAIGCQPTEITPKWAIGSSDVFSSLNTPNSSRRNHFTVFDAREAMYRSLTGRSSDGKPLQPSDTLTKPEDIRNAYWATTFRALGDVLHLVQDMGQPQHTRNDPHAGNKYNGNALWEQWVGHKSVYENYIDAAAKGESFITNSKNVASGIPYTAFPATSLNYGGYDPVAFTNYLSYFTTPGSGDVSTRQGLADYSNRGFFSAGKNLGQNEYLFPSNDPNSYGQAKLSADWNGQPLPNSGSVILLTGTVTDSLNPAQTASNVPLTTYGLFDQFLIQQGKQPAYTLNRYNYDAMANLLIPRAVGYSAGLINYFFRGKIDILPDPNNGGKYLIKNLGKEDMKGTFTLYYDATDGNRYPVAGTSPDKTWESLTIPAGGQVDNLSLTLPTNPAPKKQGDFMLVFNGDMGEEKQAKDASGNAMSPGAVVAKHVSVKGGTLYLVGADSMGRIISFKADESGTHLISGYDPSGKYVAAKEFDPLPQMVSMSGGYPIAQTSLTKQVQFSPGIGGYSYRTLAVTLINPRYYSFYSYVLHPVTGNFEWQSGVAWRAGALDAPTGAYIFNLTASGQLNYQRWVQRAPGDIQQTSGTVMLPSSVSAYYLQAMLLDGVAISGDGLRIGEIEVNGGVYPNQSHTYYDLALTLGDSVQASLEQVTQTQDSSTKTHTGDTVCPAVGNDVYSCSYTDQYVSVSNRRYPFGYINGNRWALSFDDTEKSTSSYQLAIGAQDGGCRAPHTEEYSFESSWVATDHFSDGTVAGNMFNKPKQKNYVLDYCTGVKTYTSDQTSSQYSGYMVVRPLTANAGDSIYYRYQDSTTYLFRGIAFGYGNYVGEGSPGSEVFFATPDKRFVIQEGRIPKITIPSNVVKLYGALWL